MPTKIHGKDTKIMLKDMLYVPDITFTLISIRKCNNAGYQTMFAQQKCIVKDSKGNTLLEAPKFHSLYHLDCDNEEITACPTLPAAEIHGRSGHISQKSMKQLLGQQMISGLEVSRSDNTFTCDACIQVSIDKNT